MSTSAYITIIKAILVFIPKYITNFYRYHTLKPSYPGKIACVRKTCNGLYDQIHKGLDKLSILYDGKDIDEHAVLLESYFVNIGSIDISNNCIELQLESDCRWRDARITHVSHDLLTPTVSGIGTPVLNIHFELLKIYRAFHLEALADIRDDEITPDILGPDLVSIFDRKIDYNVQIANTSSKLKHEALPPDDAWDRLKTHGKWAILACVFFLGVLAVYVLSIVQYGIPSQLQYKYMSTNDTPYYLDITPQHNGTIAIDGIHDLQRLEYSIDDFLNIPHDKIVITISYVRSAAIILLAVIIMALFVITFIYTSNVYRTGRLRKLLVEEGALIESP